MKKITLLIINFFSILFFAYPQEIKFETSVLLNSVALHPQIFDVQKDGKNDIVVVDNYVDAKGDDGENVKSIVWISGVDNKKTLIYDVNYRSCDMAFADIDQDGYLDLIGRYDTDANDMNATGSIFWLRNPYGDKSYDGKPWVKTDIGSSTYSKDICIADFNRDGKLDVVARAVDHKLNVYIQETPKKWQVLKIEVPSHDGTDVGDMNNDGIPDIVINGMWFETTKDVYKTGWIKHDFAPEWYSQKTGKGSWFDNNTRVRVSDMDNDGWNDIIISDGENAGYPVYWYRNPGNSSIERWEKNRIGYMNFCHTLQIADMDNDGDKDIVCGELIDSWNSPNPNGHHPVVVFVNKGNSLEWKRQVIAETACYGGKVGDIDNDGDLDIIAPKNWNQGPLYLWRNKIDEKYTPSAVKISETVTQGIPALKIDTPFATFLYDKAGGGFISMIDKNGNDWISFKNVESTPPVNNAASKYRGIPNLGISGPDNDAGHPGFDVCTTKVLSPNVIETTTKTGNWKFRWSFYNNYAKFTMIKTYSGVPYWFLYEGTPAGKYDSEKMYWGNNLSGRRDDFPDLLANTGSYNNWNWIYSGQKGYPRVLFLKQLGPDDNTDLFSYMGSTKGEALKAPDGMVCFGFGRSQDTQPVLQNPNTEFIIGFIDSEIKSGVEHDKIAKYLNGLEY